MISLLRAEWMKLVKNANLTSALVWIYPIGAAALYIVGLMLIGAIVGDELRPSLWDQDLGGIWGAINTFPSNVFGRLLPLAYMAVAFAGEYQWGTWKNILPRRARPALILAKQTTLTALVTLSLALTGLVICGVQALRHALAGVAYEPALTAAVFQEFSSAYLLEAGLAVATLWSLAAVAAVMAVLTRSVLGGLLLSFGVSIGEQVSMLLFMLIGDFINKPELVNLYAYMPSYHIANLRSWLQEGAALTGMPLEFHAAPALWVSLLALLAWTLFWSGLAAWLFQRQDITT